MSRAHLSTAAEVKITDFGLSKNMQLGGTDVKNIQELCEEKTPLPKTYLVARHASAVGNI